MTNLDLMIIIGHIIEAILIISWIVFCIIIYKKETA
jgi:hypothetical protein